jgi:hypothetical protein
MILKKVIAILSAVIFAVGAGLCVASLVYAVEALEWGRVVLYSVCLAACIECLVLLWPRLKNKNEE